MFQNLHLLEQRLFLILGCCCLCLSACAEELHGRVVRVADGDTVTILSGGSAQHKIRLYGIDAPESHQAFGQKSRERLAHYVSGKDVTVKWKSKDKYGRILGTVWLGSTDINLQMLRDGFAWHYKRFDTNPVYAAAESEARAARRGLWVDPNPVPPEEFRHGGKSTVSVGRAVPSAPSAATSRIEYRAGNAMPVGSRTPAPVNSTWPETGYWLSTNSNKRHNRNCENYRKTRGYPCSKSEGVPCGKCGG